MIDDALFALLMGDAGVISIIGDNGYPIRAPQNLAPPWLRWQMVSWVRDRDLAREGGLIKARFQFDCIGSTATEAQALREAVRACVNNWTDEPAGIVDAELNNIRDAPYEQVAEKFYFMSSLDFIITYEEQES